MKSTAQCFPVMLFIAGMKFEVPPWFKCKLPNFIPWAKLSNICRVCTSTNVAKSHQNYDFHTVVNIHNLGTFFVHKSMQENTASLLRSNLWNRPGRHPQEDLMWTLLMHTSAQYIERNLRSISSGRLHLTLLSLYAIRLNVSLCCRAKYTKAYLSYQHDQHKHDKDRTRKHHWSSNFSCTIGKFDLSG